MQISGSGTELYDQQQAAQQRAYRERHSGKKKIQAFAGDGKAVGTEGGAAECMQLLIVKIMISHDDPPR